MKRLAGLGIAAMCVVVLGGCVTAQTYDEIHVRGWTQQSIDQRFPPGTPEKKVFAELGSPFSETTNGSVTRWDYVGGTSAQQVVTFVFNGGKLVDKKYGHL
jgi:outer membrane protein assembly factor BamE (lipoprotein component of BamABCDE complex)